LPGEPFVAGVGRPGGYSQKFEQKEPASGGDAYDKANPAAKNTAANNMFASTALIAKATEANFSRIGISGSLMTSETISPICCKRIGMNTSVTSFPQSPA